MDFAWIQRWTQLWEFKTDAAHHVVNYGVTLTAGTFSLIEIISLLTLAEASKLETIRGTKKGIALLIRGIDFFFKIIIRLEFATKLMKTVY
jgi:hypothetical protein